MKLNFVRLIIIVVLFVSCKKQRYPAPGIEGEPVFFFKGQIDAEAVSITAGKEEYYMYASFAQDTNYLYSFIADLRKAECSFCSNNIKIIINDRVTSGLDVPVEIDQALYPGLYPIMAGAAYSVQFNSDFNKQGGSPLWDFGDGTVSQAANPAHVYSRYGKYNVSLSITDVGACVSNIFAWQKIGFPGSITASISTNFLSDTVVQFFSNAGGAGPFTYLWQFGDGVQSTLANPVHIYSLAGAYPVSVRVINASDTINAKYNFVTLNDFSSCAANYGLGPAEVLPFVLRGVTIEWTDNMGTVYTSNSTLQPLASYFEVLSVENYLNNERGEATKKLRVRFSCKVYNGNNSKTIQNAEAILCIAYKS